MEGLGSKLVKGSYIVDYTGSRVDNRAFLSTFRSD